ncbi:MAG: ABC transporter ATP-binding protein/permease [Lachnospiraceae bacterium]|jgi:ABC-type multidrug transport system fused ATPase/permease subunit|nr:ABC transporter ATP-binding protein/permease [Lachnospiraceae bacterium]
MADRGTKTNDKAKPNEKTKPKEKTKPNPGFYRKTAGRVLSLIWRYRVSVAASFVFAAAAALSAIYAPILIGRAIDACAGPEAVDFTHLFAVLKELAAVTALATVATWLMNHTNNRIVFRVVADMRERAFAKLEVAAVGELDAHSHGDLVSRIISDADQFADGLMMGFTQLFSGILTIVATLCIMFGIQPVVGALVVALTPVSLFAATFITRRTFSMFALTGADRGVMTGLVEETIGNLKVVKAFSQEKPRAAMFEKLNARLADSGMKATFFSSLTNPVTRFVNGLVYASVAVAGALFALSGRLSVGQLASFLAYANQYTKPFNEISGVVAELQNALACASRVFEVLEMGEIPPDAPDAAEMADVRGDVEFAGVRFSYGGCGAKAAAAGATIPATAAVSPDNASGAKAAAAKSTIRPDTASDDQATAPAVDAPESAGAPKVGDTTTGEVMVGAAADSEVKVGASVVGSMSSSGTVPGGFPGQWFIKDMDIHAAPGQTVAIVGPTGCGKTTLINLLMGFYEVGGGSIRIDGHDMRGVRRDSWRRSLGMVLQDTWLKSGTVRQNIAYGKPDASMEEVEAAARAAHAHGFIRRMPQGYDTAMGEDGGDLSQGQKQLLCIARLMLVLPPILILDEATSSLDIGTEIRVQQAFGKMMEGRTVFVVAHRLSTIRGADQILVMKDGSIVERGRHGELLEKGGLYSELYESQFA